MTEKQMERDARNEIIARLLKRRVAASDIAFGFGITPAMIYRIGEQKGARKKSPKRVAAWRRKIRAEQAGARD